MNETFKLEILAADRVFYSGPCSSLILPTPDGKYGIMARHEDAIVGVSIGDAKYTDGEGKAFYAVFSRGICKIEDNEVLVLVETAERPEEIDRNLAEREAAEARQALYYHKNVTDTRRAQARMARAVSRLRVADKTEID